MSSPRIAWLGPTPTDVGGVPAMAGQIVLGLAEAGAEVELFLENDGSELVDRLVEHPLVTAHPHPSSWRYDKWYSSTDLTKLLTGSVARIRTQQELVRSLLRRHGEDPFTIVYRLSQLELFALRRHLGELPPIVLHPEVHAQGERYHHWRERGISRRTEKPAYFAAAHAYLRYRSIVQRRDVRHASQVIAPSKRFAAYLRDDYGVAPERLRVLPNVIDLERFQPPEQRPPDGPLRILYVSRMSVRKGLEQVVGLSHRLDDLAGKIQIDCIGGASLFSNYQPLLEDLNPRVARDLGQISSQELPSLYRSSHIALQPSWYEPFANTVAEALASGLPVVVTDEVGAGEGVDPFVCRVHRPGDLDTMERHVRDLVAQIEAGEGQQLAQRARQEASERFGRSVFAQGLLEVADRL